MTTNRQTAHHEQGFRFYSVFAGIFVTALVLVPSTASKFIAIGPVSISGATLIFPIVFIFNDLLTEVYGYSRSRRIIWTGMACQILASFTYWLVGVWPAAPFWHAQEAYDTILASTPRITLASLIAYFFGEFANSVVLSKMKYNQAGRRGFVQAWRFVASTAVGEAFDSAIFMTIGFAGVLAVGDLLSTMLTIYLAKVAYEVVALPVSIRCANLVKRLEGVDAIDRPAETNYNPFAAFFRNAK
jgi:uncharacterized integral membrane protein (TIGR00697 family)